MPHVCASCYDAVVAARTLHPLAVLESVRCLATTLVFPPGLLWSAYFLFWGVGIAPHDPLGTVGVAWGSSALRASVLPDLPSLCRGKTGDSTQLPSLQLFSSS